MAVVVSAHPYIILQQQFVCLNVSFKTISRSIDAPFFISQKDLQKDILLYWILMITTWAQHLLNKQQRHEAVQIPMDGFVSFQPGSLRTELFTKLSPTAVTIGHLTTPAPPVSPLHGPDSILQSWKRTVAKFEVLRSQKRPLYQAPTMLTNLPVSLRWLQQLLSTRRAFSAIVKNSNFVKVCLQLQHLILFLAGAGYYGYQGLLGNWTVGSGG